MARAKLTSSEKQILRELIFPETVGHIQAETELSYGTIRDDLIKLINHGYIEVSSSSNSASSAFYDSDHVEDYFYKATKLGLKYI